MTEDIIVFNHVSRHKLYDYFNPHTTFYHEIDGRNLRLIDGVYYYQSISRLNDHQYCKYISQVFDRDLGSWRLLNEDEIEPINKKLKSGVYD